jgi:hypothetical protein
MYNVSEPIFLLCKECLKAVTTDNLYILKYEKKKLLVSVAVIYIYTVSTLSEEWTDERDFSFTLTDRLALKTIVF